MPEIKKEQTVMCTAECCHDNHHSPVRRMIKVLAGAIIILFVLLVGVGMGKHSSQWEKSAHIKMMPFNMKYNGAKNVTGGNSSPEGDMTIFRTNASPLAGGTMALGSMGASRMLAGTRVAGTITNINATTITVLDNGGNEQVVYSTANTVILNGEGEIPLSGLKTKQFIVVYVSVKDGQNLAQTIQIQ